MTTSTRRSFVIYAMAYAMSGATPFLLLPVLTQRLTPQEFGEASLFLVFAGLLGNLAGLNAQGFVAARFYKSAEGEVASTISTSLLTQAAAHGLSLLVLAVAAHWVAGWFGMRVSFVVLSVPTAMLACINIMGMAVYQFSGRPWHYFRLRAAQAMAELALCGLLLLLASPDAGARVWSYMAATALVATGTLAHLSRQGWVQSAWKPAVARDLLRFGLPMLPHVGAGMVVTYADRLLISNLIGTESAGLYMSAMQVGMVMLALVEPLNRALAPWLFKQLSQNDPVVRRQVVVRTYQLFLLLAVVGLAIALAAWFFFNRLLGPQYAAARSLVPWMVAGYVLQGMYYSVVNYMFYAERTARLAMATGGAALLGLGISFTLIRYFGLPGAGAAFVLNSLTLLAIVWMVAARTVPMPWLLWRHHDPS